MRHDFVRTLIGFAERDERVVLLTGDLGFRVLEPFAERFPDRFLNAGVAEQNMIGIATGLADAGFRPYVYSIATFAALRPYEFIRNGPVLHQWPVAIVGVGGGFEYGPQGPTHHALEDLAAMRALRGVTVIAPVDGPQLVAAMDAARDQPGPVYMRLSKNDIPSIAALDGRFAIGRAETIQTGTDVALIATGAIAGEAVLAARELERCGISCAIAIAACIAPAPVEDLVGVLADVRVAVAIEAHAVDGGLGSLVCEIVAERRLPCQVIRCGVEAVPDGRNGTQAYLHRIHGLDAASIARRIIAVWDGSSAPQAKNAAE
jgi:transketolase